MQKVSVVCFGAQGRTTVPSAAGPVDWCEVRPGSGVSCTCALPTSVCAGLGGDGAAACSLCAPAPSADGTDVTSVMWQHTSWYCACMCCAALPQPPTAPHSPPPRHRQHHALRRCVCVLHSPFMAPTPPSTSSLLRTGGTCPPGSDTEGGCQDVVSLGCVLVVLVQPRRSAGGDGVHVRACMCACTSCHAACEAAVCPSVRVHLCVPCVCVCVCA